MPPPPIATPPTCASSELDLLRLVDALDRAGRREAAAMRSRCSCRRTRRASRRSASRPTGGSPAATMRGDRIRWRASRPHRRRRRRAQRRAGRRLLPGAGETGTAVDFRLGLAYGLAPPIRRVADAYGWALFRGGGKDGALELLQKAVILAPGASGPALASGPGLCGARPQGGRAKRHAQAALADPPSPTARRRWRTS